MCRNLVKTGYVQMGRGAKGASLRMTKMEKARVGRPATADSTAGGVQLGDLFEEKLGDGRVARGAGRGEFVGGGGGNGDVGQGFVALASRGDEQGITADDGVVRCFAGARLEDALPKDGFGIFEVALDEELRFLGGGG